MQLSEIVPWGRTASEYRRMFALQPADLAGRILGCGDGPASFNAEMSAAGHHVTSVDPVYAFQTDEIQARIDATYDTILAQAEANRAAYVWHEFTGTAELGAARLEAMQRFLADFPAGKQAGRYVEGSLPVLPFADDSFDLALCSHLLFLYSEHLDVDFHIAALAELLRVAHQVRIFPLLTLACDPSPHLAPVLARCAARGHTAEQVRVPYEFQRGGHTMLVVQRD